MFTEYNHNGCMGFKNTPYVLTLPDFLFDHINSIIMFIVATVKQTIMKSKIKLVQHFIKI